MSKILAKNKKAFFDYEILENFEAGIVLEGWEVKSIKEGNLSLKESHVSEHKGEMMVYNMYVSPWRFGGREINMEETRPRKLLLHRKQIDHLMGQEKIKRLTIVPLDLHLNHGVIKMNIALARGKKKYDKRERLKERDKKRQIERDLKSLGY